MEGYTFEDLKKWIDEALDQEIPEGIVALNFNLYDDEDADWSAELIGAGSFDMENDDWACDEVTDFGTREEPFSWHDEDKDWEEIQELFKSDVARYLAEGKHAAKLQSYKAIGVGFVDGEIELFVPAESEE